MPILVVQHRVRDYDGWKPIFDEHEAVRGKHGARGHRLYAVAEDRNDLVVAVDFETADGIRAFMADPTLREAMQRGGVEGDPVVRVLEKVEEVAY